MTIGHSTITYCPSCPFVDQLKERGRFKYTQEKEGVSWSICTIDFQPLKIADRLLNLSVTHRESLGLAVKKDKNEYLFSIKNSKNELMFEDIPLDDIEDIIQEIFDRQTQHKG